MQKREDQGYRNPAYIYDEGKSGGGPDTRSSASASSSSSRSSMKVIGSKLKVQGRRWYIWLALIVILLVVVIIVAVTATLVLKNKATDDSPSSPVQQNSPPMRNNTNTTSSSSSPSSTSFSTSTASTTTSTATMMKTTTTATSQSTTTSTSSKATTTIMKLSTFSITVTTSSAKTSRGITGNVMSSEGPRTNKKTVTTTPQTTNGTTESNFVTKGNLSVSMSNILYYPGDVKSIMLRCTGRHKGDWKTITIRRQFKDSYEPVAVGVLNDNTEVEVFKFYPNVSHTINIGEYEVALTLFFDPFLCSELTNFTCAFANEFETVTGRADISIYMPPPRISLPHSIIEDSDLSLNCVAEAWGTSARLIWQFKPEFATDFMRFSVDPDTNITRTNCSSTINSTLVFNPSMYEDGAVFKCLIVDTYFHPQVIQKTYDEAVFNVVPSNYCDGKRQFTIHPHPHRPCDLVVYCLDTGPLVYQIKCEPGHCYDTVKTACVPE